MKNLKRLGHPGRLLSGSKSGYMDKYGTHVVVFNANLFVGKDKIWYGDLDLTLDKEILLESAKELNQTLYVLYEMDGRFENEDNPKLEKYLAKYTPQGEVIVNPKYEKLKLNL